MGRIEKTVFISYRRTNFPWARLIYQDLTQHGYDVFLDYKGIASGDFERVIIENIKARAHFLVLLTPSALDRCRNPTDWLRREIETALATERNVIPLMLEGFDFGAPAISSQLTGRLATLKQYNGLRVPPEFVDEAMERLRTNYLNVPLTAVVHPMSLAAQRAAIEQTAAAHAAPAVTKKELKAHQWFERAFAAIDFGEQLRLYSEAIRLKPDFAEAFIGRGNARDLMDDHEGAIADHNEAIRLNPDDAKAFIGRGNARDSMDDHEGAIADYNEAIRLNPDDAEAFFGRGRARSMRAIADFNEAIRLNPDDALAFSLCQSETGEAIEDLNEAMRLNPGDANVLKVRGELLAFIGYIKGAHDHFKKAKRPGPASRT